MWKPTLALVVYYAVLLVMIVMPDVHRHKHNHTHNASASQYWYVQRLDDGRVLVGCGNGTSANPADAMIQPTDIQNEVIVDCGTREADAK